MNNEQVAKDLEAAAKEIETRGHCQGEMHANGKICMLQSIYLGTGYQEQPGGPYNYNNESRRREAENAVASVFPYASICAWNNEAGRTGEEVAAKLREVATSLTAPTAA